VAQTAKTQNVILKTVLDPSSHWEVVGPAGDACGSLAVNPQGELFFRDLAAKSVRRIGLEDALSDAPGISADRPFAFTPDGKAVTVDGVNLSFLAVTHNGSRYATDCDAGKVWLFRPDGSRVELDSGLKGPAGITLSPDGLWLAVMESQTHWGYSYRVKADGLVELKQRFYWMHVPDTADESGAGAMGMDRDGIAYAATSMGVQIFDRNGRSRGILPLPEGGAENLCFAGPAFQTLYVTSRGRLYRRRMKSKGAPSFIAPFKLPPWGAG